MERHGEIIFLSELVDENPGSDVNSNSSVYSIIANPMGKYVRITGCLKYYDPRTQIGIVMHNNCSILIEISLSNNKNMSVDDMYQLIGEIQPITALFSTTTTQTGLDMDVYIKNLIINYQNGTLIDDNITSNSESNPKIHIFHRYFLKARVNRNVNGLDMKLYELTILTRRSFLQVISGTSMYVDSPLFEFD